jgi:hypothetical protein
MGIKKSDIAGLTGAATGAIGKAKAKMDKAKASQSDPIGTVNKSASKNSAAGYGQNSADQAAYNSRYGAPNMVTSGDYE